MTSRYRAEFAETSASLFNDKVVLQHPLHSATRNENLAQFASPNDKANWASSPFGSMCKKCSLTSILTGVFATLLYPGASHRILK